MACRDLRIALVSLLLAIFQQISLGSCAFLKTSIDPNQPIIRGEVGGISTRPDLINSYKQAEFPGSLKNSLAGDLNERRASSSGPNLGLSLGQTTQPLDLELRLGVPRASESGGRHISSSALPYPNSIQNVAKLLSGKQPAVSKASEHKPKRIYKLVSKPENLRWLPHQLNSGVQPRMSQLTYQGMKEVKPLGVGRKQTFNFQPVQSNLMGPIPLHPGFVKKVEKPKPSKFNRQRLQGLETPPVLESSMVSRDNSGLSSETELASQKNVPAQNSLSARPSELSPLPFTSSHILTQSSNAGRAYSPWIPRASKTSPSERQAGFRPFLASAVTKGQASTESRSQNIKQLEVPQENLSSQKAPLTGEIPVQSEFKSVTPVSEISLLGKKIKIGEKPPQSDAEVNFDKPTVHSPQERIASPLSTGSVKESQSEKNQQPSIFSLNDKSEAQSSLPSPQLSGHESKEGNVRANENTSGGSHPTQTIEASSKEKESFQKDHALATSQGEQTRNVKIDKAESIDSLKYPHLEKKTGKSSSEVKSIIRNDDIQNEVTPKDGTHGFEVNQPARTEEVGLSDSSHGSRRSEAPLDYKSWLQTKKPVAYQATGAEPSTGVDVGSSPGRKMLTYRRSRRIQPYERKKKSPKSNQALPLGLAQSDRLSNVEINQSIKEVKATPGLKRGQTSAKAPSNLQPENSSGGEVSALPAMSEVRPSRGRRIGTKSKKTQDSSRGKRKIGYRPTPNDPSVQDPANLLWSMARMRPSPRKKWSKPLADTLPLSQLESAPSHEESKLNLSSVGEGLPGWTNKKLREASRPRIPKSTVEGLDFLTVKKLNRKRYMPRKINKNKITKAGAKKALKVGGLKPEREPREVVIGLPARNSNQQEKDKRLVFLLKLKRKSDQSSEK